MKIHWLVLAAVLALNAVLFGCAGNQNPLTPDAQDPAVNAVISNSNAPDSATSDSHYLWGYWTCRLDEDTRTIEVIPARTNNLHVNVLMFLQQGTPYLLIKNLVMTADTIDVDVELRHPFPGMSQYTGFDVRGIFIVPGSVGGYDDSGILHADPSETYLTNADGWTRWWNPGEFPIGDNIFSYMDGHLGTPYDGYNLDSTLNAYKYFCDDLDNDDGLDQLEIGHRGLFQSGYANERHYSIHYDSMAGLVFNYAVDASWDTPNPDPPVVVPDDFPPEANAPEAYRIEPHVPVNTLFYEDDVNKGGTATVAVDVYDWFGCDYTNLRVQRNDGWVLALTSPAGGTPDFSTYEFDLIGADLGSSDPVELLISAESMDATYGLGDLSDQNVATYMFYSVPVSTTAFNPIVMTIDPDNSDLGEILIGVQVTGVNFAVDAQVSLIDDDTGTIVIDADNEVVTGGTSISCDLDLTDDVYILPGEYDVRVTNPGTGLYGELDKGFTVNNPAHPWPSWRGGDLNQASSEYVGYGDAIADTSPKWSFSAVNQGNAGCAVARDGSIYFTVRNCALYGVNPDGTEKWMFQPQTPWISLCPAVDDEGYVYTCMGSPSANYLYKVDPDTGTQVWSCYLGSTPCFSSAPAIGLDGSIYIAYSSYTSAGAIQQVLSNGTLGWSYWIPSAGYSYSWQLGCAILPNGNIIAPGGTHGRILCFEPDGGGTPLWTYQYTNWTLHTPAVGPEGNIYFSTWSGGDLVCLNSSGEFQWSYNSGFYIWSSPCVDPNTGNIFWGDRTGHFRCFDNEGNIEWDHFFSGTEIDGSAAVDANGDVYVAVGHQPSAPFVGLVKMDGTNGDILWQSDNLGYLQTHSPSIGADGTVYLTGHFAATALYAWGE